MTQVKVAIKRKDRTRSRLRKNNRDGRKRVCVFISNKYMYAQLIDDVSGKTLMSSSTRSEKLQKNKEGAVELAQVFANKMQSFLKGEEEKIVFDRGVRRYHGRIKSFADALRKRGVKF